MFARRTLAEKTLPILGLASVALALTVVMSGCSLSGPSQRTVRIVLPDSVKNRVASTSKVAFAGIQPSWRGNASFALPTSLSGFSCYGLSIVGSGVVPSFPGAHESECVDEKPPGQFGGLVTRENGVFEMSVTAGAARKVRLFGIQSNSGCPSMDEVISRELAGDSSLMNSLGEPILLGEALVDLYSDKEILIEAFYDSATAQPLFAGCGGGDDFDSLPPGSQVVPLTGAYAGHFSRPYSSPTATPSPAVFSTHPTLSVGAPEIIGSVEVGDAGRAKVLLPENYDYTPPAVSDANSIIVIKGAPTVSPSDNPNNAALQLQWDVTDQNLAGLPYVGIQLLASGGQSRMTLAGDGTIQPCATPDPSASPSPSPSPVSDPYGAFSAVFSGADSAFIFPRRLNSALSPDWQRIYTETAKVVLDKGGRKIIVLNVESAFQAPYGSSCGSAVSVMYARLFLMPSPKTLTVQTEGTVPPYGQQCINIDGGIPPYSVSVTSGAGSLDGEGDHWHYHATGASETVTVHVMDSGGSPMIDHSFSVGAPLAATQLQNWPADGFYPPTPPPAPSPSPQAYVCNPFDVYLHTADNKPGASAANFNLGVSGTLNGGAAGSFYATSDCSDTAVSSFAVPAGAFAKRIYYKVAGTGSYALSFAPDNGLIGLNVGSMHVAPLNLQGSTTTNVAANSSTNVTLMARDSSNNPVPGVSLSCAQINNTYTLTAPAATGLDGNTVLTIAASSNVTQDTVTCTANGVNSFSITVN